LELIYIYLANIRHPFYKELANLRDCYNLFWWSHPFYISRYGV